jgi:hypothetical protein
MTSAYGGATASRPYKQSISKLWDGWNRGRSMLRPYGRTPLRDSYVRLHFSQDDGTKGGKL